MFKRTHLFLVLFVIHLDVSYGTWNFTNSCTTPNGERGQCVSISSCPILNKITSNRNKDQQRLLRESECGFSNMVCCGTTSSFVEQKLRKKREDSSKNETSADLLPDRSWCGYQTEERIISGQQIELTEYPWMALLQYIVKPNNYTAFKCGGTLISKRYVLTAAHCITGRIATKIKLYRVRLGEWNTTTDIDCVSVNGKQDCNAQPVDLEIEETILHPDYNSNSVNKHNDIALLRLNQDVVFTDFIRPICLPSDTDEANVGDRLVVAGWGRTENRTSSSVKLQLRVPIVSAKDCSPVYRSAGINLIDSQICAGGEQNKDSCAGDSGGPLMNTFKNNTEQWYIEGVVSLGAVRCGTLGLPALYTKVKDYLPWIKKSIKP